MSLHRWYCPFCGANVFSFEDHAEVHYMPGHAPERRHLRPPAEWMQEQIDAHLAEHAERIVAEATA